MLALVILLCIVHEPSSTVLDTHCRIKQFGECGRRNCVSKPHNKKWYRSDRSWHRRIIDEENKYCDYHTHSTKPCHQIQDNGDYTKANVSSRNVIGIASSENAFLFHASDDVFFLPFRNSRTKVELWNGWWSSLKWWNFRMLYISAFTNYKSFSTLGAFSCLTARTVWCVNYCLAVWARCFERHAASPEDKVFNPPSILTVPGIITSALYPIQDLALTFRRRCRTWIATQLKPGGSRPIERELSRTRPSRHSKPTARKYRWFIPPRTVRVSAHVLISTAIKSISREFLIDGSEGLLFGPLQMAFNPKGGRMI